MDHNSRFTESPVKIIYIYLKQNCCEGIGGSVRSFMVRDVEVTLASDEGDVVQRQDLWVVQHDLSQLPPEEVSRILRLPSVLGRDLINRFHFSCDYQAGIVRLER